MEPRDLTWVGLAFVLLIGGLFAGQRLLSQEASAEQPTDSMTFRQWLWTSRGLDLAVQAGLILTGALAIAALLPRPGETQEGAAPGSPEEDKAR